MTRKTLYLILQTVVYIALAVMLAASAITLYQQGLARRAAGDPLAQIYTPEAMARHFEPIAPVLFAAVGMTLAGWILGAGSEENTVSSQEAVIPGKQLSARVHTPSEAMQKEQRRQCALTWSGWITFGLCVAPMLLYLLRTEHFPEEELEQMFSSLVWHVLPWAALGVACLAIFSALKDKSRRREADAARQRLAEERAQGQSPMIMIEAADTSRAVTAVRALLIVAAAVMVLLGALNGSLRDVLIKAINLCTECVGLG